MAVVFAHVDQADDEHNDRNGRRQDVVDDQLVVNAIRQRIRFISFTVFDRGSAWNVVDLSYTPDVI